MAETKKYQALSLGDAEAYLYDRLDESAKKAVDRMEEAETLIYAELLKLHERIDEIENQAADMMSPDKMADLATSFLGGKF